LSEWPSFDQLKSYNAGVSEHFLADHIVSASAVRAWPDAKPWPKKYSYLFDKYDKRNSHLIVLTTPETRQSCAMIKERLGGHLNFRLQQLCRGIGFLERNTYYSLRSTAILKIWCRHGTKEAKDIAFHMASSNTLFYYNDFGVGDDDMQQFRIGRRETMIREDLRGLFSRRHRNAGIPRNTSLLK
jgi:hypothetical protein